MAAENGKPAEVDLSLYVTGETGYYRSLVQNRRQEYMRVKTDYEHALRMAHKRGISYRSIAGWIDLTEAAIRMQFKRRGWDRADG